MDRGSGCHSSPHPSTRYPCFFLARICSTQRPSLNNTKGLSRASCTRPSCQKPIWPHFCAPLWASRLAQSHAGKPRTAWEDASLPPKPYPENSSRGQAVKITAFHREFPGSNPARARCRGCMGPPTGTCDALICGFPLLTFYASAFIRCTSCCSL